MIYTVSNANPSSSTWFVDPAVVNKGFIDEFDKKIYSTVSKNVVIQRHHLHYLNDRYAPAWKTIEFMTFGNICTLYDNIKCKELKQQVAANYGLRKIEIFDNYINTIRVIRNACAHGNHICDLKLSKGIKKGPIANLLDLNRHDICGILLVLIFMLESISDNRKNELIIDFKRLVENVDNKEVIKNIATFSQNVL